MKSPVISASSETEPPQFSIMSISGYSDEELKDEVMEPNPASLDDPFVDDWQNFQWNGQERPSSIEIGLSESKMFWNNDWWNNSKWNSGTLVHEWVDYLEYSKSRMMDSQDESGWDTPEWRMSWNEDISIGMCLAPVLLDVDEFISFELEDWS